MMPDLPSTPARVGAAETPHIKTLTGLVTAVVVIAALRFGRTFLIPVTLAILLSFLMAPLVDLLGRARLGRHASVLLSAVIGLGLSVTVAGIIGAQVGSLAEELPKYQAALESKVERFQAVVIGSADNLIAKATSTVRRIGGDRESGGTASKPARTPATAAPKAGQGEPSEPSTFTFAQRLVAPILGPLETLGIVLVVTIFILLQREDLRDRLIRLCGTRDLHRTTTALDEAAHRLSRYFVAQFGLNLGAGIVVAIGLSIIGVPGAILLGVITSCLRFVPYVGVWMAAALALALAATGPDWSMLFWTLGLFVATDLLAGQVLEPWLYGRSTGLSPVAVIVAAIFWSGIWGPVGLILSTPLTLCLVILGRHVERLQFLDVLFGDKPPLTPATAFYQRLLADDPDSAIEQAEELLKSMSLVEYYDQVLMEGLRLARNDVLRGVIPPEHLARMRETLDDIVDGCGELAEPIETSEDVEAGPAATAGAPVLCVAGRGSFDDALSAILAQLLRRHGAAVETVNYARHPNRIQGSVELAAATGLCVVSMDAESPRAYLRVLVHRLHERAPLAALFIGLAPAESIQQNGRFPPAAGIATFSEYVQRLVQSAGEAGAQAVAASAPPRSQRDDDPMPAAVQRN
jgi:predicted PurR-regulated permease PerM